MKNIPLFLAVFAAVLRLFVPTMANAQGNSALVAWVSTTGDDGNTTTGCQQSSPCQNFAAALSVLHAGGEIHCVGPYGVRYGNIVSITFSVTIDCRGALGSIVENSGSFTIDAPGDIVTLRGVALNGLADNTDSLFTGASGIVIQAASKVVIEDCKIDNFPQSGISVTTSANAVLNVWNTSITNAANGISFAPTGGAVNGSIDHTKIAQMSGDGIASSGAAYFTVTNSLIGNAAGVGISAGAGSVLEVDSSSISNNRTAFATSGGIIRISRNVIYDNTANFSISGGMIATAGNNSVAVNGSTVPNGTVTQQ